MKKQVVQLLILIIGLSYVYGCSPIDLSKYRSHTRLNIPKSFENTLYMDSNSSFVNWYKRLNDPNLNHLVSLTLKKNLDLQIVKKTIQELKYEFLKAGTRLYPTLDFQGGWIRQRQTYKTKTITGKDISIVNISNSFNTKIVASYELDFWKKIHFEKEATRLEFLKSKEDENILVQSIISTCIEHYFELMALNAKLDYYGKKIEILNTLDRIYARRYKIGLTNFFTLQYYKDLLLKNEVIFKDLIKQKKYTEQKINNLIGSYPHTGNIKVSPFNFNIDRLYIPKILPSELLKRRPDIKKSMLNVEEKLANLGYARSIRYPSINLSANVGYISDKLNTLIRPESRIWAVSSSLLFPIFNMNKLKYNEKQKIESVYKSILEYQKTVLNGFFEVESTLMERRELENIYKIYKEELKNKTREYTYENSRYKNGIAQLTDLLEKKLSLIDTKINIIDTRLAILKNQVLLFKVLGGDYVTE